MGGKTSHLFVGGEDVGGTSSLVPGVPHSRYFFCFFSVDNLYLSTYVRTWYVSATMVLYS